jgi:hypothetical protein
MGFLFYYFSLKFFKRLLSSELLHTKINLTSCLFRLRFHLYGHKRRSNPSNRAQKMPESQQMFFGIRLVSRIFEESNIWGIFQQLKKVRQPIGRKDSLQTVIRTSTRLESCLYKAAQNFEDFSRRRKHMGEIIR